jgi:radical SAM PhpK family P-methyltransferase
MNKNIDCLIIGHNEMDFKDYEKTLRKMGVGSGAYRNLNLSYIRVNGKLCTADEVFNMFSSAPLPSTEAIRQGETFSATIGYLGSYLNKRGYTFDCINSFREEKEELAAKLSRENILTIAITTTLYGAALPILEIIDFIKKYNQTAKIIVGGPYIFTQFRTQEQMVLEYLLAGMTGVDFFVINSQGEAALVNIIHALKNNLPLEKINNLYYKTNGGYTFTPYVRENNPLSENIVDWRLFSHHIGKYVNTRTSISCPYSCAFCSFPQNAGQFQTASVEAVEREFNSLAEIQATQCIQIIDDTFNVPVKRFKEILRMMIRNKYGFKWHCHLRCQFVDEESAQLMKESGCEGVFLGIESGNEQMLDNMNKTAHLEKFRKGIAWLKEYQISTLGSFFIGFPGETPQTVQDTIGFIEETEMDFYQVQSWYCDPISPIWERREEFKLKGSHFQWSHTSMDGKTAANLLEKMFLAIEKSICVPRYNFDFDHLFHLLHRGMTLEQVKTFLRIFNNALKEKLVSPSQKEVSPMIINNFKEFFSQVNLHQV